MALGNMYNKGYIITFKNHQILSQNVSKILNCVLYFKLEVLKICCYWKLISLGLRIIINKQSLIILMGCFSHELCYYIIHISNTKCQNLKHQLFRCGTGRMSCAAISRSLEDGSQLIRPSYLSVKEMRLKRNILGICGTVKTVKLDGLLKGA